MATNSPHQARKNAARDLAARTGMGYTAALRHVQRTARPPRLRHRWIFTPELRGFFAGDGWHGGYFNDFYTLLDNSEAVFPCDGCGNRVDALAQEATLRLKISAYEPDLAPVTHIESLTRFHAGCRESGIDWIRPQVPEGNLVTLTAPLDRDVSGSIVLTGEAFLDDDGEEPPLLWITAAVESDPTGGQIDWLHLFDFSLTVQGWSFGGRLDEPWALRVVTGWKQGPVSTWVALRGVEAEPLFAAGVALPAGWAERAGEHEAVQVVIAPVNLPVPDDEGVVDWVEVEETQGIASGLVPLVTGAD